MREQTVIFGVIVRNNQFIQVNRHHLTVAVEVLLQTVVQQRVNDDGGDALELGRVETRTRRYG